MYKAFEVTLGIFAAMVVVVGILCGAAFLYDYATAPTPISAAQRAAQQAEYDKRQADDEAQAKAEEERQQAERLAQQPHFTPYPAYVVGKWGVECCTLYTDTINQGLAVGTVEQGEQVQVLSNVLYDSVQVKNKSGRVGWIHPAEYLSLSK